MLYSSFNICDIRSRRKRKKKIRRIIDDAELGEETKKKIAIEKVLLVFVDSVISGIELTFLWLPFQERQERLKSLQEQFSVRSNMKCSASYKGTISEGVSAEVVGDASAGYIVNVMREEGEEPVRIPPSLSSKLKAHQVYFPQSLNI